MIPHLLKIAVAGTTLNAATPALAEVPAVVASIRPIHSLVAAVMEGVGEPALLLDGLASPHTYALRPSDAERLSDADIVVWVGPGIEPFLDHALTTLAPEAELIELSTLEGLSLLPYRDDAAFEAHGHGEDEAHGEHAAEAAADGHAHGNAENGAAHDDHAHDAAIDAHIWLDPANAEVIAAALAERLAAADPDNAAAYRANAEALATRLDALGDDIRAIAAPVTDGRFVVFHDAFQYFENAFGVEAVAAVTVSPEITPGAQRIAELQARIAETGVSCLVSEPQFPSELVALLATDATRTAVLDPIGVDIEAGPSLYEALLRQNAEALAECIGGDPS